jgi:hypothetical protein
MNSYQSPPVKKKEPTKSATAKISRNNFNFTMKKGNGKPVINKTGAAGGDQDSLSR